MNSAPQLCAAVPAAEIAEEAWRSVERSADALTGTMPHDDAGREPPVAGRDMGPSAERAAYTARTALMLQLGFCSLS